MLKALRVAVCVSALLTVIGSATQASAATRGLQRVEKGYSVCFTTTPSLCMGNGTATPKDGAPVLMLRKNQITNTNAGRFSILVFGKLSQFSARNTHNKWLSSHASWLVVIVRSLASPSLCVDVPPAHVPPPGTDDAFFGTCATFTDRGIDGIVYIWNLRNQMFPFIGNLTRLDVWPYPSSGGSSSVYPWCLIGSTVAGEGISVTTPGILHEQFTATLLPARG
jgi:hypothetical protein